MSLKDLISKDKIDQAKNLAKEGAQKAKEFESSETGAKAKKGFSQLRAAAKDKFGK